MPLATPSEAKIYTTIYSDFNGADFTNDPSLVYKKRSPSLLNMISDEGGNPKKRPGWKTIIEAPTEDIVTVYDGSVSPVEASTYEVCRLNGIEGTLFDIDLTINGYKINFSSFSETATSYVARYVDSSGNLIAYISKNTGSTYADLFLRKTSELVQNIKAAGSPYKITIHQSAVSGGVRDMWSFSYDGESHLICLVGKTICRYEGGQLLKLRECKTTASNVIGIFMDSVNGGHFYLLADNELYVFENVGAEGTKNYVFNPVEPYVPMTLISRSPNGGGELYEGINLLTRERKESFLGDETSTTYYLSTEADTEKEINVWVKNGEGEYVKTTDFTTDGLSIIFTSAHPPVVIGEDNVMVQYFASSESSAGNHLMECKVATIYENKMFLSGSTDEYGSYVWYSSYDDPSYFPDLNYIVVGNAETNIMGLVGLGEYLGVVKEANSNNNTIYLVYSTTFDDNAVYACKQSIAGIGAISLRSFKTLNDEQLFLSKEGICGVSEEAVKNRSFYINKKLCAETGLENAVAVTWNGYYLLCVNDRVYIMDGRQKSSWRTEWTNYLYECFYWENVPASAFAVYEDKLWFGTSSGAVCRFKSESETDCYTDDGESIPCEWSTPLDNDGATHLFKTMMKKGSLCVIEGDTSVDAYIKADDEDEIHIGTKDSAGDGVPTEFYFKKKKKKYKRLQLIFRNNVAGQGLKINEITKLYTVGNYSKNKAK